MTPWVQLLGPALAVAAIGALVLGGDALWPGRGRLWGWVSVLLLLALLLVPSALGAAGVAPHRAYVAGPWSLFVQRVLLCSAILAVLGSMDWLESRAEGRQAEYLALLLFSTSGMMMIPGARDWALLVVSFELMGIPLYALVAWAIVRLIWIVLNRPVNPTTVSQTTVVRESTPVITPVGPATTTTQTTTTKSASNTGLNQGP